MVQCWINPPTFVRTALMQIFAVPRSTDHSTEMTAWNSGHRESPLLPVWSFVYIVGGGMRNDFKRAQSSLRSKVLVWEKLSPRWLSVPGFRGLCTCFATIIVFVSSWILFVTYSGWQSCEHSQIAVCPSLNNLCACFSWLERCLALLANALSISWADGHLIVL